MSFTRINGHHLASSILELELQKIAEPRLGNYEARRKK